jgi:hypothetical protein
MPQSLFTRATYLLCGSRLAQQTNQRNKIRPTKKGEKNRQNKFNNISLLSTK